MTLRGGIATADVAAREAEAEMDPSGARLQAFLTSRTLRYDFADRVQMVAFTHDDVYSMLCDDEQTGRLSPLRRRRSGSPEEVYHAGRFIVVFLNHKILFDLSADRN